MTVGEKVTSKMILIVFNKDNWVDGGNIHQDYGEQLACLEWKIKSEIFFACCISFLLR